MPWIRRKLRDAIVYVKATANGQPAAGPDGRVDILYKPVAGAKVYRASVRNLAETDDPADQQPIEIAEAPAPAPVADDPTAGAPIIVYTDGACTGNPGPAGIGAVIMNGAERRELSEYLGQGTNNIAELTAILRALEEIPESERNRPVVVHSDSSYSIGLLTKPWKAKANAELVGALRALAARFPRLRFVKVKGHAGIPENERCDELARAAIDHGRMGRASRGS